MGKIVKHELDLDNPPELTDAQRTMLDALSDDQIDTSDIPELGEKFWKNAVRNPFFKPVKQQLTLRLDADLIDWFRRRAPNGRGYQSDINRALREYVASKQRKAG